MNNLFRFCFSFQGRASRSDLWLRHALPLLLLYGVLFAVLFAAQDVIFGAVVGTVATLLAMWSGLAVSARRCHDRDRSAWFILVGMIPVVSIWYMVELCFLKGTVGPNRFGPDRRDRALLDIVPDAADPLQA